MRAAAVIVAAGQGRRLGLDCPKCFAQVCERPLFIWSLLPFLRLPEVSLAVLVVPTGWEAAAAEHVGRWERLKSLRIVAGGAERPLSVRAGLEAVCPEQPDIVAIHDGARPLATEDLVLRCLRAAAAHRAALAAASSTDTLKEVHDGVVVRTLDRRSVWRAQTPQAFDTNLIWGAYHRALAEGWQATDDAVLVERLGVAPVIVESDWTNLKVTTPEHLVVAEALLRQRHGKAS